MRKLIIAFFAVALLAAAVGAQTTDAGPATASAPAAEPAAETAPALSPEEQARRAKLLAKVGDHVLTVGDFEEQLSSPAIPAPVRAGYADPARIKQEFDERVERMAIAVWALKQGIDRRADVRREVRKLYRGITLYREIHDNVTEESIPEADVAAYYDEHKELYNRPETVNGGMIVLADRTQAEAALQRALAAKGNRADLTKLVRELSTDAETKRRGGSIGYFDRDGRLNRVLGEGQPEPPRVEPAIVSAAFTLQNPFDVFPQLVDTAHGPAVVFILNRTPAVSRTVEEVGPRIRLELVNQRRNQARDQYLELAQARYNVHVNDANFEHVVIAPSTPDSAMMGPHGGMLDGPMGMPPVGPPTAIAPPAPGP
jgi:peptidyl-prolyl cis-trans isomerase C